jgi:hypothetical protein
MDPNDLRNCVEAAINELIDPVAWLHCEEVNEPERENIRSFLKKWKDPDHDPNAWVDEFLQASLRAGPTTADEQEAPHERRL